MAQSKTATPPTETTPIRPVTETFENGGLPV